MIDIMRPPGTMWEIGLKKLIELLPNDITMIEVGCFSGDSSLIFLKSGKIKKFYAIDAWKNNLDCDDLTTVNYDLNEVEKLFDERTVEYPVVKIKGISVDVVDQFEDNSLDFIYLDSCHSYDYVKKEISLYYNKLKVGGIIAGHDYTPVYPGVIRAVNEFCGKPISIFEDTSWIWIKR